MLLFPRLVLLVFAVYQMCGCNTLQAGSGVLMSEQGFLVDVPPYCSNAETYISADELNDPPKLISKLFKLKPGKNKKLVAALLAFPFPFGIVGLHRIYLGTSPHVPLVYIGTLGGGFGLIPLIDFFAILFEKDLNRYINNNKVFMWIN
jgi:TM2 domain-containing membrane protein YozV